MTMIAACSTRDYTALIADAVALSHGADHTKMNGEDATRLADKLTSLVNGRAYAAVLGMEQVADALGLLRWWADEHGKVVDVDALGPELAMATSRCIEAGRAVWGHSPLQDARVVVVEPGRVRTLEIRAHGGSVVSTAWSELATNVVHVWYGPDYDDGTPAPAANADVHKELRHRLQREHDGRVIHGGAVPYEYLHGRWSFVRMGPGGELDRRLPYHDLSDVIAHRYPRGSNWSLANDSKFRWSPP